MADVKAPAIIQAAGALAWRQGTLGLEVALVHRPQYDDWTFPKGKTETGEHVLRTALREVAEETGARVVLGRPLRPTMYETGSGIKRVSYWVARCADSARFEPNQEIDQVQWLPATAAAGRLSYEQDAALAAGFLAQPVRTAPFILLRHASAGRRRDSATDLARPLDHRGAADAGLLALLLSCYERCQVISSAAERCLATVRPYAGLTGAAIQVEPSFTIANGAAADAARRCAELAGSGLPTLICAHRENVPVLLDAACRALGTSPPDTGQLPKGGFWVLQSAGGTLISSERHDTLS